MKHYYICNKNGEIIATGYTNGSTVKKLKPEDNIFYDKIPTPTMYHDFKTNSLKERPTLPYDIFRKFLKNENYILTDIPKNTIIKINGVDHGVINDGKLVVSFPIQMIYKVELLPPFPYYPKTITIEVKNG
jgi:hypothetical protein